MRYRHPVLGAVIVVAAAIAGTAGLRNALSSSGTSATELRSAVQQWLTGQYASIPVSSKSSLPVEVHDPVLMQDADGEWIQVGIVQTVRDKDGRSAPLRKLTYTRDFTVRLYDHAFAASDGQPQLELYRSSTSLDKVVETMIPRERQKEIAEILLDDWAQNEAEIIARLEPVLNAAMQNAARAVEDQLGQALQRQRPRLAEIGARYQEEILRREIVPLVRREVFPIVAEETRPAVTELGRTLWDKVSVMSFAWRYLYDASPLPRRDRVRREFQRFVNEEALPEIESRSDEFVEITERILDRISRNPRIREVVRKNLKTIASDQELQQVIREVFEEVILENEVLRRALRETLRSPEARSAFAVTSSRLEPTARRIGDAIFGTREGGVTPEFAKVLRTQILMKDRRWFVLTFSESTPANSSGLPTQMTAAYAGTEMAFPLRFEADQQSPLSQLGEP